MNAVVAKLRELEDPRDGRAYLRLAGLVDRLELKEGYAGEHTAAVSRLALAIAKELNLSASECRCVELGALLHDVGKLRFPIGSSRSLLPSTSWNGRRCDGMPPSVSVCSLTLCNRRTSWRW